MRRGGFTLVEMMVAGALGIFVLSTGTLVVATVAQQYGRSRELAEMRRQSELTLDQLGSELQQAGLGLPAGRRLDGINEYFPPAVLAAVDGGVVFQADLPRPDSNFNGVSLLSDQTASLAGAGLALLNELNGSCDPYLADFPCSTNTASLLFGPTTVSCGSNDLAPSCPWSLNRYRTNEVLIVANAVGGWVEATTDSSMLDASSLTLRYLKLGAPLPPAFLTSYPAASVATPDRLFYRISGGVLQRDQCWGTVGTTAVADTLAATPCVFGLDTGTGWENLATGVTRFALTPLDANGVAIAVPVDDADLPRVARVAVALTLQRGSGTNAVAFAQQTEFALRSWKVP